MSNEWIRLHLCVLLYFASAPHLSINHFRGWLVCIFYPYASVRFKATSRVPLSCRSLEKVQKSIIRFKFLEIGNFAGEKNKGSKWGYKQGEWCSALILLMTVKEAHIWLMGDALLKLSSLGGRYRRLKEAFFSLTRKIQNNPWFQLNVLLWPLANAPMEKNSHSCLLKDAWFQPVSTADLPSLGSYTVSWHWVNVASLVCMCVCAGGVGLDGNESTRNIFFKSWTLYFHFG